MHCEKFCLNTQNTPKGLGADLNYVFGEAIQKGKVFENFHHCPVGFTHNPSTKEATHNMIKNGGRFSICHNNPWKWDVSV